MKGRIFYVETADLKIGSQATIKELKVSIDGSVTTMIDLSGAQKVDMRFGRDHNGELYVMSKPDGKIYKVVGVVKNL